MNNLKIAREIMYNENQKIVIVNNGEVIYKSESFGIKPLFIAYNSILPQMKGSSCADKVIGKAAACIYEHSQVKEVYCDIITTKAKEILTNAGIEAVYVQEVEYIKNKDKTDICPVEKIALSESNFDNLLNNIEGFLKEKGLL